MNLQCYLIQRKLASLAVSSLSGRAVSRVEEHISRCDSCRGQLQKLENLSRELRDCIAAPQPSSGFCDITWDRLVTTAAVRPRPWISALAFGAAVVVVLTVGVWARQFSAGSRSPLPAPSPIANSSQSRGANASATETHTNGPPNKVANLPAKATPRPGSRTSTAKKIRRHYPKRILRPQVIARGPGMSNVWKTGPKSVQPQTTPLTQSATWTQWAAWYESYGDFRSAEAAYAAALAVTPDPALEFHAGRAAECAGDVAQAVDYYSRLLKQDSRNEAGPKKGSMLWNEAHDSA